MIDVAFVFALGVNSNNNVMTMPASQSACIQGGAGLRFVGGRGGSFGGPDFAGLDWWIHDNDICSSQLPRQDVARTWAESDFANHPARMARAPATIQASPAVNPTRWNRPS